jgi:threonine dehydrogenase-like Zn-dependent dehydrogenase
MSPTMKAWRVHPGGTLRLDQVPAPAEPREWTEIEVSCFQVSATEVNALGGSPGYAADLVREKLASGAPAPPFGHEFCGVVLTAPPQSHLEAGSRVVALGQIGRSVVGLDIPGCFAERLRLPDDALVEVSEAISDGDAASMQPLSSCLACVRSAPVREGNTVVVFGLGTMGLFILQLSRMAGARTVVGIGRRSEQLEAALAVGADCVVDARRGEVASEVMRALGGTSGADVFFEAAGANAGSSEPQSPLGLTLGLEVTAPGGSIVQVGHHAGDVRITPSHFRRKSLRYVFPDFAERSDLERAVALAASGDVQVRASHLLEGIDSLPQAFKLTRERSAHRVVGSVRVRVRYSSFNEPGGCSP